MTAITPERVQEIRALIESDYTCNLTDRVRSDLADLLDERDRMGHELAWWDERFPCDGMCSPNDGPQEDCSRHGRAPKDLWAIVTRLTAENDALRTVVEAAETLTGEPGGPEWPRLYAAVRAYRATTTGEAGNG